MPKRMTRCAPLNRRAWYGSQRICRARDLQQRTGREVDEEQARSRLANQVTEGVEHVVARVVRDQKLGLVGDENEARPCPSMRNVEALCAVAFGGQTASNEECVGVGHQLGLCWVEFVRDHGRVSRERDGLWMLRLDVHVAVAIGLIDGDPEAALID